MKKDLYFVKFSDAEFEKFIQHSIDIYAEEMLRDNEFSDFGPAYEASKKEIMVNPPEPPNNKNSIEKGEFIYKIILNGKKIGYMWYTLRPNKELKITNAFLVYVYINPENRGKGYAAQAVKKYEHYALKNAPIVNFELSVSKSNPSALNLYKLLGYVVLKENSGYSTTSTTRYLMRKLCRRPLRAAN